MKGRRLDIPPGMMFGRLTILEESPPYQSSQTARPRRMMRCQCACGLECSVLLWSLRSGATKSCGCLTREHAKNLQIVNSIHGLSRTRPYRLWADIKNRCLNQNASNYSYYGGRGITMFGPWISAPAAFIAWIEEHLGSRPNGHSIDRLNNNLGYEPGNLRWATPMMQAHNRRPGSH